MRSRVKICGITSYEDAVLALDLGADALGFNFYPASPRFLGFAAARDITRRLPPLAITVGVFVNVADPAEVDAGARAAGIQVLQLHGDESADYCRRLGSWPLIKAVRIDKDWTGESLAGYAVHAYLFDTGNDRQFGGSGKTFDWSLLRRFHLEPKIILAGGLNPANVAEAIRTMHPYGVDVCSGVESSPGKKDAVKMAAFMNEVLHASRES
jgi:phosphoribosylanthranilate isomerase